MIPLSSLGNSAGALEDPPPLYVMLDVWRCMVLLLLLACLLAWGAHWQGLNSHAILTTETSYRQGPVEDTEVRKVRDLVQCLKCS